MHLYRICFALLCAAQFIEWTGQQGGCSSQGGTAAAAAPFESGSSSHLSILYLDGLIIQKDSLSYCQIIQYSFFLITLMIIHKKVIGAPLLLIMSNQVSLIYLLQSMDWQITLIAWEQFSISQYLQQANGTGIKEGAAGAAATKVSYQSATMKYFLLSAQTTGQMIQSIAQQYGQTGRTDYIGQMMINSHGIYDQWPFFLITTSQLFKQGAAPLHNWAPDLYDSLDTNITTYVMTIPKIGVLMLISMRQNEMLLISYFLPFAIQSIQVGSIAQITQNRMKRFLAYSSISNQGFMLCIIQFNPITQMLYQIIYMVSQLAVQAQIQSINPQRNSSSSNGASQLAPLLNISDQAGLYRQNPYIAFAFSLCLFSFAGFPPLAGFYAKLFIQRDVQYSGYVLIAFVIIFASIISATQYIRISHRLMLDRPLYPIESVGQSYQQAIQVSILVGGVQIWTFNGSIQVWQLLA